MAQPLARLRMNLDFMSSPIEEQPGLLIRDSCGYSDAMIIVPPVLVECLELFDGMHTDLDLREALVRMTGQLDVGQIADQLSGVLREAGFLEDENYVALRQAREQEFAESAVREPSHAGSAYPIDPAETRQLLDGYMADAGAASYDGNLIGIAAPHVSPFGGWKMYRDAYSALDSSHAGRTVIVLGTSHSGDPDTFGLTRKPYVTPLGATVPDLALIDELAKEPAARMEDYCHAFEHSIEFQVLFLQHVLEPRIRVVPILCGSFYRSVAEGKKPEDDPALRSFFERLGEIAAREGRRLLWVLGIDMAHMGLRYGDPFAAEAYQGHMQEVERRDRDRIGRVNDCDPEGFWDLVTANNDDLKWCGSSPLYTFMKAVPQARGVLRGYEQWNIDERSVVSYGALAFVGS
jgi:AmmeMemoRadiSam system protein B